MSGAQCFSAAAVFQCDGQYIPLPSLQGIAVLNIPSYAGGTNFWGGTKEDDVSVPCSEAWRPSSRRLCSLWCLQANGSRNLEPQAILRSGLFARVGFIKHLTGVFDFCCSSFINTAFLTGEQCCTAFSQILGFCMEALTEPSGTPHG